MEGQLVIEGQNETLVFPYEEILYLQADGRYTNIVTEKEKIMRCRNLKTYEEQLDHPDFFRVSRSCIVYLDKIRRISGQKAYVNDTIINVSRDKIGELKNQIRRACSVV